MKINSFNVTPNLPENLKALSELSQNMWFTWNWEAIMMFVSMDDDLWHRSHRNPKWILGNINPQRLEDLSKDPYFQAKLDKVHRTFREYLSKPGWFANNHKQEENDFLGAYFSMEFGIGEGLPMYSGGLGMLSGDHMKSSSDLGLPLVGMGLFYQRGYIQQVLNRDGWQVERFPENDWANMPVEKVRDVNGVPLQVTVPLGIETIKVGIWRVPVGKTSLYLLDTNLPENPAQHRLITEQLYGGDRENRIKQEIVLGLGGVRALELMNIKPTVYHINEGHSAFLLFERIRNIMHQRKLSFSEAREAVWATSVFTTHTPVIAGNEHFDPELVRRFLEPYSRELGISWDEFLDLGKVTHQSPTFCMTVVALKLAAFLNGVAKLHGEVSREMWRNVWPGLPQHEVPITSITNGVHTNSWISHEHLNLYTKYMSTSSPEETAANPSDCCDWNRIHSIPDEEFWNVHLQRKQKLIGLIRSRYKRQLARQGSDVTVLDEVANILDPNVLTIGFARRFATYKRATLLFRDLDRLAAIINNPKMPVQLVFAGKAHQADVHGKEFVKAIAKLMTDPRFKGKLIFVEDYNMNVARYLVQGVDVWLNNPTRPMEASGTSGMKASINGVLNLSVMDGWWCEAYRPDVGWAIGGSELYNDDTERDNVESEAICNLLSKEIAPLYYNRDEHGIPHKWIEMSKNSIKTITPFFSTHRMVREYYERFYVPAHRHSKLLFSDGIIPAVAQWRKRIQENWSKVYIQNVTPRLDHEIRLGDPVPLRAKVWLGNLSPDDVAVEICIGKLNPHGELAHNVISVMQHKGMEGDAHVYEAEVAPARSGRQDFAMRVLPRNGNIPHPFMPYYICWEE
jgi:starch phosphorylase